MQATLELAMDLNCEIERRQHAGEIVIRQTENKIADDVNSRCLDLPDDRDNLRIVEGLLRAVPDVLAARFDAEREPTDPGAAQFAQHLRLDRVDACIGPEIQVKAALDQPVAN